MMEMMSDGPKLNRQRQALQVFPPSGRFRQLPEITLNGRHDAGMSVRPIGGVGVLQEHLHWAANKVATLLFELRFCDLRIAPVTKHLLVQASDFFNPLVLLKCF